MITPYKDRFPWNSQWVDVYWNKTKELFSVRGSYGENRNKVLAHSDDVLLAPAGFVVHENGNRRVRESGVKNVHAWIGGCIVLPKDWLPKDFDEHLYRSVHRTAIYDPFKHTDFMDEETNTPIKHVGCHVVHCFVDVLGKPIVKYGVLNDYDGSTTEKWQREGIH